MSERVVGNYKLLTKVGEGGMGSVYRGVDIMLDRPVAIKVLRPELTRDPDLVERFRKEAKTLAKLNHPAIATVFAFFREGDEFFLVMEFVEGRNLAQVLRSEGALDPRAAVELFQGVLEGIGTAHRQGVIHRDVKPENIMVTPDGSPKIMDFGIAWVVGQARMTRAGHLVGTVHYMSPEQVRGEDPGAASDIYSLGAVLYEAVTGRLPHDADSDFELMRAHLEETPQPPRDHTPELPEWLDAAIVRALDKNPGNRFEEAEAFRRELERGAAEQWPEMEETIAGWAPVAGDDSARTDGKPPPVPPTRLGDASPPPTRLAASAPPPTRLAEKPAEAVPASPPPIGEPLERIIGWWRSLAAAQRLLAAAVVFAGIILLALVVVLIGGSGDNSQRLRPTPLVVAEGEIAAPHDAVDRQEPPERPLLPFPATATPQVRGVVKQPAPTRPPMRATPLPTFKQPPVSPETPPPTAEPSTPRPQPTRPTARPSSADPRDGVPSLRETGAMVRSVEGSTDVFTKSLRRDLDSNGRWRPQGADLALWEEVKTLERATDRLSLYVRKRQGMSKLRKDSHPSKWKLDELAEARSQVRDLSGRIPHIQRALAGVDVGAAVRDNWRALRTGIDDLQRRLQGE